MIPTFNSCSMNGLTASKSEASVDATKPYRPTIEKYNESPTLRNQ